MSAQKRAFNLYKPLRFGKYAALSIVEIYSGTGELPAAYCAKYLLDALKLFKPLDENYEQFFQVKIVDNVLNVSINPKKGYYKGVYFKNFDFCREVNNTLSEFEFGFPLELYNGYELIEEYHRSFSSDEERGEREELIKFIHDEKAYNIMRYGKPDYISWLIKNVDFFSLSPENLKALERLYVLEFNGMYLRETGQGTYSIHQSFLKSKKEFSSQIKILNGNKWIDFEEIQRQASEAESFESWGDSGSSSRNRDFYSDDDEDQIMRGLSNGDGDLFGF